MQACVAKRVVGRCSILLYRLTTPASALLITLVLMLANLPMIRAVCTICGGFFAGCTGGADGQTCEGTAAVKKNAAALVATSTTALSLAGMFGPKVTRVFNTTVLGLIKTYATLPVAGTPYVCDDHTPVENIEAVSAGKVTKSEVQIHFSRLIATYATLPDAEAHTKIKVLEAQISLLSTISDDQKGGASNTAVTSGVYLYVWGKCSEVATYDGQKIVFGSEKDKNASSAKINTPTSEAQFFEILNLWQAMVVHAGLDPYAVVFDLIQNTVWEPLRQKRSNWMLAHETILVYRAPALRRKRMRVGNLGV